jgi:gluconate kinase
MTDWELIEEALGVTDAAWGLPALAAVARLRREQEAYWPEWVARAQKAERERDEVQAAWQKNVEDLTAQYAKVYKELLACSALLEEERGSMLDVE